MLTAKNGCCFVDGHEHADVVKTEVFMVELKCLVLRGC